MITKKCRKSAVPKPHSVTRFNLNHSTGTNQLFITSQLIRAAKAILSLA
jgi:hypothetical protein